MTTQPNLYPDTALLQWHILPLPACCPVSGNPQPGSQVVILYHARTAFLEVYGLRKMIDAYIGGHESGLRDMEGMIQDIAIRCATLIQAPVTVGAYIRLQRFDGMVTIAQATP